MVTDLAHVAFAAHDVDKTLAFYRTLGIEEAFRLHQDDGSLMLVYLHIAGDRFIEIFPGGPEPANERTQSFRHICLMVGDLAGYLGQLEVAGIEIERPLKQGLDLNLQAWIRDPDGNQIELMQISEESPQRAQERAWTASRNGS